MVNTIASGGFYTEPSLVEGLVDENLSMIQQEEPKQPQRMIPGKPPFFAESYAVVH